MENVTAGFGEYNLKEMAQEFRDSASPTELEYVLPETVGSTNAFKSSPIWGSSLSKSFQRCVGF